MRARDATCRRISDFISAMRARSKSMSAAAVGQPLLGALLRRLGARDVDVLRPLGDLRQHGHPVGQHLDEAERDRQVVLLLPVAVPQLADLQRRQQRRVAGQDAEVALGAGQLDLVHLLA